MLFTTCLTPFTFLAIFSAFSFCLSCSTAPLSVTTPCFTSTCSAPPFTSGSSASLILTWSVMVSSVTGGGSFATQRACSARPAKRTVQSLEIIFTGHCTPVQRVEKGALFPPARFHAHMQIQIDLGPEEFFHFVAGQSADLFQHGAPGPDHDGLLPVALHPDGGIDARDLGRLFPLVHHHRHRVRHLLPGGQQHLFANQFGRQESLRLDRKSTRLNSSHLGISYA